MTSPRTRSSAATADASTGISGKRPGYVVNAGEQSARRGAWQHVNLPGHAGDLRNRVAFAWRAMDAFYEEDERIVGHAADMYHRIDIRRTLAGLVVRSGDTIVAETTRPLVLYESGFAPRWYVPRDDIDESRADGQRERDVLPI